MISHRKSNTSRCALALGLALITSGLFLRQSLGGAALFRPLRQLTFYELKDDASNAVFCDQLSQFKGVNHSYCHEHDSVAYMSLAHSTFTFPSDATNVKRASIFARTEKVYKVLVHGVVKNPVSDASCSFSVFQLTKELHIDDATFVFTSSTDWNQFAILALALTQLNLRNADVNVSAGGKAAAGLVLEIKGDNQQHIRNLRMGRKVGPLCTTSQQKNWMITSTASHSAAIFKVCGNNVQISDSQIFGNISTPNSHVVSSLVFQMKSERLPEIRLENTQYCVQRSEQLDNTKMGASIDACVDSTESVAAVGTGTNIYNPGCVTTRDETSSGPDEVCCPPPPCDPACDQYLTPPGKLTPLCPALCPDPKCCKQCPATCGVVTDLKASCDPECPEADGCCTTCNTKPQCQSLISTPNKVCNDPLCPSALGCCTLCDAAVCPVGPSKLCSVDATVIATCPLATGCCEVCDTAKCPPLGELQLIGKCATNFPQCTGDECCEECPQECLDDRLYLDEQLPDTCAARTECPDKCCKTCKTSCGDPAVPRLSCAADCLPNCCTQCDATCAAANPRPFGECSDPDVAADCPGECCNECPAHCVDGPTCDASCPTSCCTYTCDSNCDAVISATEAMVATCPFITATIPAVQCDAPRCCTPCKSTCPMLTKYSASCTDPFCPESLGCCQTCPAGCPTSPEPDCVANNPGCPAACCPECDPICKPDVALASCNPKCTGSCCKLCPADCPKGPQISCRADCPSPACCSLDCPSYCPGINDYSLTCTNPACPEGVCCKKCPASCPGIKDFTKSCADISPDDCPNDNVCCKECPTNCPGDEKFSLTCPAGCPAGGVCCKECPATCQPGNCAAGCSIECCDNKLYCLDAWEVGIIKFNEQPVTVAGTTITVLGGTTTTFSQGATVNVIPATATYINNSAIELTQSFSNSVQNNAKISLITQANPDQMFYQIKFTGIIKPSSTKVLTFGFFSGSQSASKYVCIDNTVSVEIVEWQSSKIYFLQQTTPIGANVQLINSNITPQFTKISGAFFGLLQDITSANVTLNLVKIGGTWATGKTGSTMGMASVSKSTVLLYSCKIDFDYVYFNCQASSFIASTVSDSLMRLYNLTMIQRAASGNSGVEIKTALTIKYGGVAQSISNSDFIVSKSNMQATVVFKSASEYSGLICGYMFNTRLRLLDSNITYDLTPYRASGFPGVIGHLKKSPDCKISNLQSDLTIIETFDYDFHPTSASKIGNLGSFKFQFGSGFIAHFQLSSIRIENVHSKMRIWIARFAAGFIGQVLSDPPTDSYYVKPDPTDTYKEAWIHPPADKNMRIYIANFTGPATNDIQSLHGTGNLIGKADKFAHVEMVNITAGGTTKPVGGWDARGTGKCKSTSSVQDQMDNCIIAGTWDRRCAGTISGHVVDAISQTYDNISITEGLIYSFEINAAIHGLLTNVQETSSENSYALPPVVVKMTNYKIGTTGILTITGGIGAADGGNGALTAYANNGNFFISNILMQQVRFKAQWNFDPNYAVNSRHGTGFIMGWMNTSSVVLIANLHIKHVMIVDHVEFAVVGYSRHKPLYSKAKYPVVENSLKVINITGFQNQRYRCLYKSLLGSATVVIDKVPASPESSDPAVIAISDKSCTYEWGDDKARYGYTDAITNIKNVDINN